MAGERREYKWGFFAPFFLFLSTFLVYLHNLSKAVYAGDSGDFLSAIAVYGVPHPPGYPLFTVLGILANALPINATPAYKVGVISALSASLAVCMVYFIILTLTKNKILSLFTAYYLAFFYVFWLYAEVVEVFALNVFLGMLLLFLAIKYYQTKKILYFWLLAFFAGLSLTNHHTIILLFPTLLALIYAALKRNLSMLKKKQQFSNNNTLIVIRNFLKASFLFILGFSIYIYVPIAASQNPPVNWGNASNLQRFVRLVLRMDYGTFSSAVGNISLQAKTYERYLELKHYVFQLFANLSPIGFLLAVLGMIYLYSKNRFLLSVLLMGFLLTGLFFVAYAAFPIGNLFNIGVSERFYILSSAIFILFIPFGVILFLNGFNKLLKIISVPKQRQKSYILIAQLLLFLLPAQIFYYNFPKTNFSDVWIGDTFAKDILFPVEKNAVVFVAGDTQLFNVLYVRYGLKVRTDLKIINFYGLQGDSYYLQKEKEVSKRYKGLYENKKEEFFTKVLEHIALERPVYIQVKVKTQKDSIFIPHGLLFKFTRARDTSLSKEEFLDKQEKIWSKLSVPYPDTIAKQSFHNILISLIPVYYSIAFINIGDYIVGEYNDLESAKQYYQKAITVAPQEKDGYMGLGYAYVTEKQCEKAEEMFKKVLERNHADKAGRILLYLTYYDCFKDSNKGSVVVAEYQNMFKESLQNGIKSFLDIK